MMDLLREFFPILMLVLGMFYFVTSVRDVKALGSGLTLVRLIFSSVLFYVGLHYLGGL